MAEKFFLARLICADSEILLAFLFSFPVAKKPPRPKGVAGALAEDVGYGLLFLLSILFIVSSVYNPFIYFRF